MTKDAKSLRRVGYTTSQRSHFCGGGFWLCNRSGSPQLIREVNGQVEDELEGLFRPRGPWVSAKWEGALGGRGGPPVGRGGGRYLYC